MRSIFVSTVMFFTYMASSIFAQTKINPVTQINWPLITGAGTPSVLSVPCSAQNYGQSYQNTAVVPNTRYHCSTDGWELESGAGAGTVGSGTTGQAAVYPANGTSVQGGTLGIAGGGTGATTAAGAMQNLTWLAGVNTNISGSMNSVTTGLGNTSGGQKAAGALTTGNSVTAFGYLAALGTTTGSFITAIGTTSLGGNITGLDLIGIGVQAGDLLPDGFTQNTNANQSIYIGDDTHPLSSNDVNEIVIGHQGTGHGSNTVTIGNSAATAAYVGTTQLLTTAGGTMTGPLSWTNGAATTLANLNGKANAILVTGAPVSLQSSGGLYPGAVTLPDGKVYEIHITSSDTAFSSNLCTVTLATNPPSIACISQTPPAVPGGIPVYYVSPTLLANGTVFLTFTTQQTTGSKYSFIGYMIGTIGGSDVITWGSPQYLTIAGQSWPNAPSPVVQLSNGNLVMPVFCSANGTALDYPFISGVITSSNGGTSWSSYTVIGNQANDPIQPSLGYNESALAPFPNGDLAIVMRHDTPPTGDPLGGYSWSVSHDGGATWTAPVNNLTNTTYAGRPTLLVTPTGQLLLVGRGDQIGLTFALGGTEAWESTDEGATWSGPNDLIFGNLSTTHGDNYDALTQMPGGLIGLVNADQLSGSVTINMIASNGVAQPDWPFYGTTNPLFQSIRTYSHTINGGTPMTGTVGNGGQGQETTSATKTNGNLTFYDAGGNTVDSAIAAVNVAQIGSGTWTPLPTALTHTGTAPTITGTYVSIGIITYYRIKIVPGASTSSTTNTTWFTLPSTPTGPVGCNAFDSNLGAAFVGTCTEFQVSGSTWGVYTPTWTADTATIYITGWYW